MGDGETMKLSLIYRINQIAKYSMYYYYYTVGFTLLGTIGSIAIGKLHQIQLKYRKQKINTRPSMNPGLGYGEPVTRPSMIFPSKCMVVSS